MVSAYEAREGEIARCLAALYAPGGPRGFSVSRRSWQQVETALRKYPEFPAEAALQRGGLFAEAALCADSSLLAWAQDSLESGSVATVLSPGFPDRWVSVLGPACPPAVCLTAPFPQPAYIGGVGSRKISEDVWHAMVQAGACAAKLGYSGVSGAAEGCDTAFSQGVLACGGGMLEVLPRGLSESDRIPGICRVSLAPSGAPFSTAQAMERNALIYALADCTVVGEARFGSGGTWTGARDALRRKLGRVAVLGAARSPGCRALASLGAYAMSGPEDLPAALRYQGLQPHLAFG